MTTSERDEQRPTGLDARPCASVLGAPQVAYGARPVSGEVKGIPVATATLVAVMLAGCFGSGLPAGWRQLIITVANHSSQPATLVVGDDRPGMGGPARPVGTVDPGVVPAKVTMDVLFGIPPGSGWAIFVNPSPEYGPLIRAADVPENAAGRQPFTISIGEGGTMSWGRPSY